MGRKSETRERVRELADELASQGIVPSSRKILELLGKGSLSTISDELEAWEQGPNPTAIVTPPVPVEAPAGQGDTGSIAALFEHVMGRLAEVLKSQESTQQELVSIRGELQDLRVTHQEQLDVAYKRYEAVQRHALLQVDEARQNTAQFRERVSNLTAELDTREMAHSGKLQAAREENARLRGMLEAVGINAEGSPRR